MDAKALGLYGEAAARHYLEKSGYQILALNWRYAGCEADIIAQQGAELVIVEVKTRRGKVARDSALASLTPPKLAKLAHLAEAFQAEKDYTELALRLDVLLVLIAQSDLIEIEHFQNITL